MKNGRIMDLWIVDTGRWRTEWVYRSVGKGWIDEWMGKYNGG
jgi:hypothetical protein